MYRRPAAGVVVRVPRTKPHCQHDSRMRSNKESPDPQRANSAPDVPDCNDTMYRRPVTGVMVRCLGGA